MSNNIFYGLPFASLIELLLYNTKGLFEALDKKLNRREIETKQRQIELLNSALADLMSKMKMSRCML